MNTNEIWYTKNIQEIEKIFCTSIKNGLDEKEVLKRREKYGQNVLKEQKKESILIKFCINSICGNIIYARRK